MEDRDLVRVVKDLNSYICFATAKNTPAQQILMHVAHDLAGIVNKEAPFAPRTGGYSDTYVGFTSSDEAVVSIAMVKEA